MASALKKILFVDTNILLDFYRTRNDAGLSLLEHLNSISDKIVMTFQVEMEFKKNRQRAILEGQKELKRIEKISRPGLFSDAKAVKALEKNIEAANKRIDALHTRLAKVIENPSVYDPVYKVCQRMFNKADALNLTRDHDRKSFIRRKAMRRFLLGCPPRKQNDTSIGDAINWEWMIECAEKQKAELVIVSRDSDYGVSHEKKSFLNDHLRQEFSDRISKKRKVYLYTRLTEALKNFKVEIQPQEALAEEEILSQDQRKALGPFSFLQFMNNNNLNIIFENGDFFLQDAQGKARELVPPPLFKELLDQGYIEPFGTTDPKRFVIPKTMREALEFI